MAYGRRFKIDMLGTGGGRWTTRATAKKASKKLRRARDRKDSKCQIV